MTRHENPVSATGTVTIIFAQRFVLKTILIFRHVLQVLPRQTRDAPVWDFHSNSLQALCVEGSVLNRMEGSHRRLNLLQQCNGQYCKNAAYIKAYGDHTSV